MQAWEDFLLLQEKELGKTTVDKWLKPLKVLRFDACNLYLEAFDSFQINWFEEHVRPKVQVALINQNHKQIKVHLNLAEKGDKNKGAVKPKKGVLLKQNTFKLEWDSVNPYYSFSNFVFSENNALAYRLLCELTGHSTEENSPKKTSPTVAFNPIYIYGEKGVGKTHLLMATAGVLNAMGIKVVYTRAETFTEHVVGAIRAGEMQAFRKAYRHIDALLIDDVEVFSRKGATQEEFFHTFNTLHVEGKQIILTASCPPQELKSIEPRLVSRFEWGIVLSLETLDKQDLRQVLLNRAHALSYPLSDKVIDFLLNTFTSSCKSLNQALEALVLRTHLNQNMGRAPNLPLSLEIAKEYVADLIKQEEQMALTPQKIIHTVAGFYGIRVDDILGKSQSHDCVLPRQIAMHLCRSQLHMPFMKIGDLFSRDHSTVIASVKQIQKSVETNEQNISAAVAGIAKQLKASVY
ncbi:MAG: chromosomal replication initiator protein DnaA [Parachlamydiales bacterium]|nr:chromosomal replication initiator protein DnaA [Parachlamydiales bacterium]